MDFGGTYFDYKLLLNWLQIFKYSWHYVTMPDWLICNILSRKIVPKFDVII